MANNPHTGRLLRRYIHVATRGQLPSTLIEGYTYFVEDEGVILIRMGNKTTTYAKQGPAGPAGPQGPVGPEGPMGPAGGSTPAVPPAPPATPEGPPVGTVLRGLPQLLPNVGVWEGTINALFDTYRDGDLVGSQSRRFVQRFNGGTLVTQESLGLFSDMTMGREKMLRSVYATFKRIS